jgi:hypothetical protein
MGELWAEGERHLGGQGAGSGDPPR